MLYALIGQDAPDAAERRQAHRGTHLDRLRALQDEGRLILAGPFPRLDAPDLSGGVSGSLIVAEFASLDDARAWMEADPYVHTAVFQHYEVRPYLNVLPA